MPNAPSKTAIPKQSPRSTARNLRQLEKECAAWVSLISPQAHFHRIFDHLPGVYFFTKDATGRFMVVSDNFPRHYGMITPSSILGLNDYDITPPGMASAYLRDDKELMTGRKPVIQRIELWFDDQGVPDWYFVTKMPLKTGRKCIIGIMGVLRRASEHEMQIPVLQTVAKAVELIRQKHARLVVIAEIARECGLSLRHLQRRFQETFGFSPKEFVIRTRVRAAMELLDRTSAGAAEIARLCGFHDASAFAEQFRERTGFSPTRWRQRSLSSVPL